MSSPSDFTSPSEGGSQTTASISVLDILGIIFLFLCCLCCCFLCFHPIIIICNKGKDKDKKHKDKKKGSKRSSKHRSTSKHKSSRKKSSKKKNRSSKKDAFLASKKSAKPGDPSFQDDTGNMKENITASHHPSKKQVSTSVGGAPTSGAGPGDTNPVVMSTKAPPPPTTTKRSIITKT